MKMATLKEECKDCSVFASLLIGEVFLFVDLICCGSDVGCDGYFIYTTNSH